MAANRQTYIHTHVRNAVTLVWGSLRLAPTILIHVARLLHIIRESVQYCGRNKCTGSTRAVGLFPSTPPIPNSRNMNVVTFIIHGG